MVRGGLTEEMKSEWRPEGGEGKIMQVYEGRELQVSRNSQCKGPGAELYLVCWRNSSEAHSWSRVIEAERGRR